MDFLWLCDEINFRGEKFPTNNFPSKKTQDKKTEGMTEKNDTPGAYQTLDEAGEVPQEKPVQIQETAEAQKESGLLLDNEDEFDELNPVQKVIVLVKQYLGYTSFVLSIIGYLIIAVFLVIVLVGCILLIIFGVFFSFRFLSSFFFVIFS